MFINYLSGILNDNTTLTDLSISLINRHLDNYVSIAFEGDVYYNYNLIADLKMKNIEA